MPLPILEKIAAVIVSRLQAITTENGYEFDAESVTRLDRRVEDWTPRNLSILVNQDDAIPNPELSRPGNPPAVAFDVPFDIKGFVRLSDKASDTPALHVNQMGAAIQKAIAAGDTHWHTFDGNAINAVIGEIQPWDPAEGEHNGCTVPIVVTYRVSELDPFVARGVS